MNVLSGPSQNVIFLTMSLTCCIFCTTDSATGTSFPLNMALFEIVTRPSSRTRMLKSTADWPGLGWKGVLWQTLRTLPMGGGGGEERRCLHSEIKTLRDENAAIWKQMEELSLAFQARASTSNPNFKEADQSGQAPKKSSE